MSSSRTYDVAQICLNGHMVSDRSQSRPEFSKNFCPDCGAETITKCRECNHQLQGALHTTTLVPSRLHRRPPTQHMTTTPGTVPAFCHACGKAYPWTSGKLAAAQAMADELDGLDDADRIMLKRSIDEIAAATPMSEVAATRVKKLMPKVLAGGGETLRKLVIDIASETAAKVLRGQ